MSHCPYSPALLPAIRTSPAFLAVVFSLWDVRDLWLGSLPVLIWIPLLLLQTHTFTFIRLVFGVVTSDHLWPAALSSRLFRHLKLGIYLPRYSIFKYRNLYENTGPGPGKHLVDGEMVIKWNCPLHTLIELRTLTIWDRAPYIFVTEVLHNIGSSTNESKKRFFRNLLRAATTKNYGVTDGIGNKDPLFVGAKYSIQTSKFQKAQICEKDSDSKVHAHLPPCDQEVQSLKSFYYLYLSWSAPLK